ncbi:cyclic nucleotide-binding domain-containing protein [bacterium]|nr:cyclic nucleotide-binding domain-containing protein [bacterium]
MTDKNTVLDDVVNGEEAPPSSSSKRLAIEWAPFHRGKVGEETLVKRALRSTPLFENLRSRDWKLMSDLFHVRDYSAGEVIFEKGTPGLGMYVIVDGRVKIVTEEKGKDVVLTTLNHGDFFGEMSLIDEIERSAGAVAETQTRLVGLFRPQLQQLMTHRPRLGITLFERLAKIVVQRLRYSNQLLLQQMQEYKSQEQA